MSEDNRDPKDIEIHSPTIKSTKALVVHLLFDLPLSSQSSSPSSSILELSKVQKALRSTIKGEVVLISFHLCAMLYYYCVCVTHLLVDNNILELRAALEEENKKLRREGSREITGK